MNSYCLKILNHLSTPGTDRTIEGLERLMCPKILHGSLQHLTKMKYIKYIHVVANINDGFKPIKTNSYAITLDGLDFIENHNKDSKKFWIPIILSNAFSLLALMIAILK